MAVGGCYACMKYLLYFFNAVLFIVGAAVLVIGILLKVMHVDLQKIIEQTEMQENMTFTPNLSIAAFVFIGVGCFLVLIGIIGCCGACREVAWLLGIFFACLSVIFVLCVWAGVHTLVLTLQIKNSFETALERVVLEWDQGSAFESSRDMLDNLQTTYGCCGSFQGASDFRDGNIPRTCLVENYNKPCADATSYPFFVLTVIGGSILGIACFMLLGMLLSLSLCCAVRKVSGSNIA